MPGQQQKSLITTTTTTAARRILCFCGGDVIIQLSPTKEEAGSPFLQKTPGISRLPTTQGAPPPASEASSKLCDVTIQSCCCYAHYLPTTTCCAAPLPSGPPSRVPHPELLVFLAQMGGN